MQKLLLLAIIILLAIPTAIAVICHYFDKPKSNQAHFEDAPLAPKLLPIESGLTLAQTLTQQGETTTLLVIDQTGESILAIDFFDLGVAYNTDLFDAVAQLERSAIIAASKDETLHKTYSIEQLLPAGGTYERHIATGTNFIEHAAESNSTEVFNFPKFGQATPSRTTVVNHPGFLLDYEVEFCVRFDRDIQTVEDFDAAQKGFFLCADFTDRATLVRLIDRKNYNSGSGFSDAKSGPDFFPTGPFVVIPNDWKSFIANERMTTDINGEPRQDARGKEMMLDFRQLVERVLDKTNHPERFLYNNDQTPLIIDNTIAKGSALMSGTSEGVIFMPPSLCVKLAGVGSAMISGQATGIQPIVATVKEYFIKKEMASGRFLQVGDTINHGSSSMGDIRIEVKAPH